MYSLDHAEQLLKYHIYFENYFFFSSTAVCAYDWFLTLDREIRYIWRAKPSFPTLLYYGCRYPALVNLVLQLLTRAAWRNWQDKRSCSIALWMQMGLDICELVSASFCAAVRVFAMFDRNIWVSGAVLLIGLINPFISIYLFIVTNPIFLEVERWQMCSLSIIGSKYSYENLVIISRSASLLSDALVFTCTCCKTLAKGTHLAAVMTSRASMDTILLSDTAACFAFLSLINIFGIATARYPELIEVLITWTAVLTSLLLSRLYLDLHEVSAARKRIETLSNNASPGLTYCSSQGECNSSNVYIDTDEEVELTQFVTLIEDV